MLCTALISVSIRCADSDFFKPLQVRYRTSMLSVNYLVCLILSGIFVLLNEHNIGVLGDGGVTLGLGSLNGLFYLVSLMLMQINIKSSGVVLASVFSRLGGLIVPVFAAVLFFSEMPTSMQAAGTVISLIAIVMINMKEGGASGGVGKAAILSLMMLFFADGTASSMAKVFRGSAPDAMAPYFLLFTFASSLVLCSALCIKRHEKLGLPEIIFGTALGLPNFFASHFMLSALETVPAVVVYPIRGVGALVLITFAGVFIFKEQLSKMQWAALLLIFASIVLLSV